MKTIRLCLLIVLSIRASAQNTTYNYQQIIEEYIRLEKQYPANSRLISGGKTDCGKPLSLFVIDKKGKFRAEEKKKRTVVFINNGIHPGEPDGINASLQFAAEILSEKSALMDSMIICIVPVFNVDGSIIRGCCSRVNQNGPEEYGFRGNARNLDLNRDFIKTDAMNTQSLIEFIQQWNPDVFIDTHVSDGADYPYTMTLIASDHNKMNPLMSDFHKNNFTPSLFKRMKEKGEEMTPYVNSLKYDSPPDSGIAGFLETARFASGYMSLQNCFAFITETHMLKPYDKRVVATKKFIQSLAEFIYENNSSILNQTDNADKWKKQFYPFNYKLNTDEADLISFKGYTASYKPSELTGKSRLYYDRQKPIEIQIPFYHYYSPSDSAFVPEFYIVPSAWREVIEKLKLNKVEMEELKTDTMSNIEAYYIESYKTSESPYEGHYLHSDIKTKTVNKEVQLFAGDFIIPTNQKAIRFIMEVLEPRSGDSYFAWGFFDSILQQKEWYSNYVFEDLAVELLKNNKQLNSAFNDWKAKNPSADQEEALYFIYQRSKYFEPTYKLYPVYRVTNH